MLHRNALSLFYRAESEIAGKNIVLSFMGPGFITMLTKALLVPVLIQMDTVHTPFYPI
jgi:hypothetical protein